jgi:16S rRNA (uracil1498-N3)-methyltransferase
VNAAFAADAGAVAHVFVPALDEELVVAGADAHHLVRVRRLERGESVTAADGDGRWRAYKVLTADRHGLGLVATGPGVDEPSPSASIALAFAPTKGGQPERVVQHATELGVDSIHPLVTERTVVRWGEQRLAGTMARLERIAREAAAQCFRSRFPAVGPVLEVDDLAPRAGLVVAARGGPRRPSLEGSNWTLVVGPEGGFTSEELAGLAHASELGLGPLVLRAETAALAGCTILATLRDPWTGPV